MILGWLGLSKPSAFRLEKWKYNDPCVTKHLPSIQELWLASCLLPHVLEAHLKGLRMFFCYPREAWCPSSHSWTNFSIRRCLVASWVTIFRGHTALFEDTRHSSSGPPSPHLSSSASQVVNYSMPAPYIYWSPHLGNKYKLNLPPFSAFSSLY